MTTVEPGASPRYSVLLTRGRRWVSENRQSVGLVPAIVLLMIIGSQVNSVFLTRDNLITVLQSSAVLGVLVIAEAIVLIGGRFDLSLESTAGIAPMFGTWLVADKASGGIGVIHSGVLAVVIVVLVGAVIGLFNGVMIVFVRLNAFMLTLAMLILLRGLTYAISNGATISTPPSALVYLGSDVVGGVPIEVYIVIALFVVAAVIMRRHRFGRAIYAIGGSEEAAKAAGLRVRRTLLIAYVIGGVLASFAGLLLEGQIDSVTTQQGSGLIFTVFAAAVIGGVSLQGGRGSMAGAGLGVLFLGLIENVLTLAQVPSQVVQAVEGFVIILALAVNRFTFGPE